MTDSLPGPSLEDIKRAMRANWVAGDFGVIARSMARSAREFAHRLGFAPGTRVLDLACGTGNVAIPLARAGCVVTGLDLAPNLLEQARRRAEDDGLVIQLDEGDAEAMPYPDGSFDAVVSMFGAMFAPRPEVVVSEVARVLRPGGVLAMANWTPESFTGAMFRVTSRHVPPPAGMPAPVAWGDEGIVAQRLAAAFRDLQTERVAVDFDLPTDAAGAVAFFRRFFGPTQMAFARLGEAEQVRLEEDLRELWASSNIAADPEQHTLVPNEFLEITAVRL